MLLGNAHQLIDIAKRSNQAKAQIANGAPQPTAPLLFCAMRPAAHNLADRLPQRLPRLGGRQHEAAQPADGAAHSPCKRRRKPGSKLTRRDHLRLCTSASLALSKFEGRAQRDLHWQGRGALQRAAPSTCALQRAAPPTWVLLRHRPACRRAWRRGGARALPRRQRAARDRQLQPLLRGAQLAAGVRRRRACICRLRLRHQSTRVKPSQTQKKTQHRCPACPVTLNAQVPGGLSIRWLGLPLRRAFVQIWLATSTARLH